MNISIFVQDLRAISSVGLERCLDRAEVTGSNPVWLTNKKPRTGRCAASFMAPSGSLLPSCTHTIAAEQVLLPTGKKSSRPPKKNYSFLNGFFIIRCYVRFISTCLPFHYIGEDLKTTSHAIFTAVLDVCYFFCVFTLFICFTRKYAGGYGYLC